MDRRSITKISPTSGATHHARYLIVSHSRIKGY